MRSRGVEPRRLGDDSELASQREGIERAHVLVEIHAQALARGLHPDPDIGEDDRVLQRRQAFGETPFQRRRSLGTRYRRRASQHLSAVALDYTDFRLAGAGGGLAMTACTSSPSKAGLR